MIHTCNPGMNLWDKKQVTISGERIAKVDRVASQVVHPLRCLPALFYLHVPHPDVSAVLANEQFPLKRFQLIFIHHARA